MNEPAQGTQADLAGCVSRPTGATMPVDATVGSQAYVIAPLQSFARVRPEL